jgi:hypothetical protein
MIPVSCLLQNSPFLQDSYGVVQEMQDYNPITDYSSPNICLEKSRQNTRGGRKVILVLTNTLLLISRHTKDLTAAIHM